MSRKILVLPGDGIGPEITAEAVRVLEALNKDGLGLEITTGLLGGCAVDATGEPYPVETRAKAEAADAVLLGAVGGPQWDTLPREQRPERGLLGIRKHLNLFANLRPAAGFPGLEHLSSLKPEIARSIDVLVVRRDACDAELSYRIEPGEPYFHDLSERWSAALRAAHMAIPRPPYVTPR